MSQKKIDNMTKSVKSEEVEKIEKLTEKIDVIIPLKNIPPGFDKNLESFDKQIPINRILLGITSNIRPLLNDILKRFPKITIIDQSELYSQGYCLQQLFEKVETPWFIYFHADVSIPEGWYNEMSLYKDQYDAIECLSVDPSTNLAYKYQDEFLKERAFSGAQLFKTSIFKNIRKLDDDYVFRTEDIFFQQEIQKQGYKYKKIQTTYHFHQIKGKEKLDMKKVGMESLKATIKYLSPENPVNYELVWGYCSLIKKFGNWNKNEWLNFCKNNNPEWIPLLKKIIKQTKLDRKLFGAKRKLRRLYDLYYSRLRPITSFDRIQCFIASSCYYFIILVSQLSGKKINLYGKREFTSGNFLMKNLVVKNESGLKFLVRKGQPDILVVDDSYERGTIKILKHHLKKDDVFIDVGAHIGKYAVLASKILSNGRVICFEPMEENIPILKHNFELNKCYNNWEIIKSAVSDFNGEIDLRYRQTGHLSGTSAHDIKEFHISNIKKTVPCRTIDSILGDELKLKKINWILLDIEGAEVKALTKAQKAFEITENIIIEVHDKSYYEKIYEILQKDFIINPIIHKDGVTHHLWAKKRELKLIIKN